MALECWSCGMLVILEWLWNAGYFKNKFKMQETQIISIFHRTFKHPPSSPPPNPSPKDLKNDCRSSKCDSSGSYWDVSGMFLFHFLRSGRESDSLGDLWEAGFWQSRAISLEGSIFQPSLFRRKKLAVLIIWKRGMGQRNSYSRSTQLPSRFCGPLLL